MTRTGSSLVSRLEYRSTRRTAEWREVNEARALRHDGEPGHVIPDIVGGLARLKERGFRRPRNPRTRLREARPARQRRRTATASATPTTPVTHPNQITALALRRLLAPGPPGTGWKLHRWRRERSCCSRGRGRPRIAETVTTGIARSARLSMCGCRPSGPSEAQPPGVPGVFSAAARS